MNIKHLSIVFLMIGLVAGGAWYWQTQTVRTAPDAVFKTIKGQTIKLTELQGRPTIVTFWATDCPGCIEEIPHLIGLHQKYSQNGLKIIAVAMDYDPPNHVVAMAESKQLPYEVALDPAGELASAFGDVRLTPTTFLIDRSGHIVMQKVGVFDLSTMQQRIEQL